MTRLPNHWGEKDAMTRLSPMTLCLCTTGSMSVRITVSEDHGVKITVSGSRSRCQAFVLTYAPAQQ